MSLLQYKMSLLPIEIQHLIDDYNLQHRIHMKYICNELQEKKKRFRSVFLNCHWCDQPYFNRYRDTIPYCYLKEYLFCHQWCQVQHELDN